MKRQIDIGDAVLQVLDIGSGQPLVLAHGFPLDHTMWSHQIEHFAPDFRVIAPDLRGFGASSVSSGIVTMRQMADDLSRMLDQLSVDQPIVLSGLSMGGYVGWQFWRHHHQRLRALIQCDTRAAADNEVTARGRRYMAEQVTQVGTRLTLDGMVQKLFAPATLANQPDIVTATCDTMNATAGESVAAAQLGMAERPDMRAHLPEIDIPVLLVCGEHDTITPPAEMMELAAALPRGTFQEIPDAGHMSPLENPVVVNSSMRRFLGGIA